MIHANFRCTIVRCPSSITSKKCLIVIPKFELTSQSEISQRNPTVFIYKNVPWLDVPVRDVTLALQILDGLDLHRRFQTRNSSVDTGTYQTSHIESSDSFGDFLTNSVMQSLIEAWLELELALEWGKGLKTHHDKVNIFLVFKGGKKRYYSILHNLRSSDVHLKFSQNLLRAYSIRAEPVS